MAEAYRREFVAGATILEMDQDEAGYLRALLYEFVGGGLTTPGQPLYRILVALEDAKVPMRRVRNLNREAPPSERLEYASIYALDDENAGSWKWWEPYEEIDEEPLADWEKEMLVKGNDETS